MSENMRPKLPSKGNCAGCGKDIVPSESKSAETQDYMLYFCGLECYEQWHNNRDVGERSR